MLSSLSNVVPAKTKMPDTVATCAVCGAGITGSPHVRLVRARLHRCPRCSSWTYFPRPTAAEQAALHDTDVYLHHPYFEERRADSERLDRRCREIFARIAEGIELAKLAGVRHLDVGCDTGGFLLSAARQFGTIPVGLDVSRRAVAVAAEQGVEAYCTNLEHAPPHLTDLPLITAIDLIEHVADPRAFLRSLAARLSPSGVAYIETPNIDSTVYRVGRLLCNLTGGRPARIFERLFPPQHVQYFTANSLTGLAHECGLQVVAISTRVLPASDIAASPVIQTAMSVLQTVDRFSEARILACAVLRRR